MNAENQAPAPKKRGRLLILVAGAFGLAALLAAFLLVDIAEKKQEAKNPVVRVVELTDDTEDPAVWGKNFPIEYDQYERPPTWPGRSTAGPRRSPARRPRATLAPSPPSRRRTWTPA